MNRKIDITAQQEEIILKLLRTYLPDTEVWAYGSRIKNTARPSSDLDMVVFADAEKRRSVEDLREAFAESDLPFRVELFTWNELPEQFQKNIKSNHIPI